MAYKDVNKQKDFQKKWAANRRDKAIKEAIDMLGGKCVKCGATENLEFDHIDPKQKELKIAAVINGLCSKRREKIIVELNKCQLLCYRCHKEKTIKEIKERFPLVHGKKGYKRGCRCLVCKKGHCEYQKEWLKRKK